MELFLRELLRHIIDAGRTNLSDLEIQDLKLRKRGGDAIFRYLHSNIVRKKWRDYPGYPVKKKFFTKGLLACSYSIRSIAKATGYSIRTVREVLAKMEELKHLCKDKSQTLKGQTVYILGTWNDVINEKGKTEREEKLFRDAERDKYIKQPKKKPKENDYSMYNYDELPRDEFKVNLT